METTMRSLLALLLGAALSGCYNPDVGPNPFLCATEGKKCPDGYTCITRFNAQVCVPESAVDAAVGNPEKRFTDLPPPSKTGPVYLDGAVLQSSKGCLDAQSEPNNTSATATTIANPGLLPNWEICYAGDVDTYKIPLKKGDRLIVKVNFTNSKGDLDAALLDPSGMVIDMSRGVTNQEVVQITNADQDGNYFVGVYGFGIATNVYDLDVSIGHP
jgi:hypothetical protein